MGAQRAHQQQRNQQQQQGGFNFSYVFLIFIIIYLVAPLFKSKPDFAMTPSAEYRYKQHTPIFNAPYFVREQFFANVADNP